MAEVPLVEKRRIEYAARLAARTAPQVRDSYGSPVDPQKVVVVYRPDTGTAVVQLTGHLVHLRSETRTVTFNLTGHPKYRPCPDWLEPIVRYCGYTGEIDVVKVAR